MQMNMVKTSASTDCDLDYLLQLVAAADDLLLHPSSDAAPAGSLADLSFDFCSQETVNNGGTMAESPLWSQNHTSIFSSISATMESHSSLCAETPTSSLKPNVNQAPGGTSGSEQSDDESLETEARQSGQNAGVDDLKRLRRMESNRKSARRSRKRKQAQLNDLGSQVDQLRGESASLYKQLTKARRQCQDAATDNRVLKSDVEALRVKVKMAEDMVARGTLTCNLDHLLQTNIGSPQLLGTWNQCQVNVQGDDHHVRVNTEILGGGLQNGSVNRQNQNKNSLLHGVEHLQICGATSDLCPWESDLVPSSKNL